MGVHGFSEEARTRGLPVLCRALLLLVVAYLYVNKAVISPFLTQCRADSNGSLAARFTNTSLMAAFGCKADGSVSSVTNSAFVILGV